MRPEERARRRTGAGRDSIVLPGAKRIPEGRLSKTGPDKVQTNRVSGTHALDPASARETHLEALAAAMAFDMRFPGGVIEAARAARVAPPGSEPVR
jgi:hypothetical protein